MVRHTVYIIHVTELRCPSYLGLHNLIVLIQLSPSVREEEISVGEQLALLEPAGCERETETENDN